MSFEFDSGNEVDSSEPTTEISYSDGVARLRSVLKAWRLKHPESCVLMSVPGIGMNDPPRLVCTRTDIPHRQLKHPGSRKL